MSFLFKLNKQYLAFEILHTWKIALLGICDRRTDMKQMFGVFLAKILGNNRGICLFEEIYLLKYKIYIFNLDWQLEF